MLHINYPQKTYGMPTEKCSKNPVPATVEKRPLRGLRPISK